MDLHLTLADWLAVAGVALPIAAKCLTGIAADLSARHNDALARITGMAGRQAAVIGRTIQELPPGTDAATVERDAIKASAQDILQEMGQSAQATGATADKIATIVQGELAKLVVHKPTPAPVAPAAAPASPAGAPNPTAEKGTA